MPTDLLLFLLLLTALGIGWALGRHGDFRGARRSGGLFKKPISRDYFIGLNYLLNDEPDDAVDIFIHALEVNAGTLETHLALGTLLRRRGKVDRSIAIYQDLLAQSRLGKEELDEVKVHLIQSYISAGLLDRAERLVQELKHAHGDIRAKALAHAVDIHQLEKDWLQGVEVMEELLRLCPSDKRQHYQTRASHFYCELAQGELERGHYGQARDYLKQALGKDGSNVRVNLMMGELESRNQNFKEAIKAYRRVQSQDRHFMAEVFKPLLSCYLRVRDEKQLREFIQSCLREEANATVLLGMADYLQGEEGEGEARKFLLAQLGRKASLQALPKIMELSAASPPAEVEETLALCREALAEYLADQPQYQCGSCGFELKSLHWLCPGCARWGEVRHVMGMPE